MLHAGLDTHPGDSVGRYTLRRLIGIGRATRVYAAYDSELGRTVALKLPDAGARAGVVREAQALARLRDDNVVTVYDVGADGERAFVAMELVAGPTLAGWLAGGERDWRAVRAAFLAVARGLTAAEAVGIIHPGFEPDDAVV